MRSAIFIIPVELKSNDDERSVLTTLYTSSFQTLLNSTIYLINRFSSKYSMLHLNVSDSSITFPESNYSENMVMMPIADFKISFYNQTCLIYNKSCIVRPQRH